jgi:hypothetical protein
MKYIISLVFLATTLFSMDLGWSHNYKDTLLKAHKSGKLVYVLITSDNCSWCRKFEGTTLQDKEIQKRLYSEFEVVHLSREKDYIPKNFKTAPIPRHYFVDAKGKILYNSLGHRGVECFDSFMDNAEQKMQVSQ